MNPCEYLDSMFCSEKEFHYCLTRDWESLVKISEEEVVDYVKVEELCNDLKFDSELYWSFKREVENLFFDFKKGNFEDVIDIISETSINSLKSELEYLIKIYKDVVTILNNLKREDLASWFEEWCIARKK